MKTSIKQTPAVAGAVGGSPVVKELGDVRPAERKSGKQKAASVSIALIVHAALGVLVALIVVLKVPDRGGAVIQVAEVPENVVQEEVPEVKPRVMQRTPAAASPVANLISSAVVSPISLPDVGEADEFGAVDFGDDFGDLSGFGTPELGGAISFLGQQETAKRVVFVVDASASMSKKHVELMKEELISSLRKLPRNVEFQVLFFAGPVWLPTQRVEKSKNGKKYFVIDEEAGETYTWSHPKKSATSFYWEGKGEVPAVAWQTASRKNVRKLTEALEKFRKKDLVYGTHWILPLKTAMKMKPKPDVVFFVTDGLMGGKMDKIVHEIVRDARRGGRTKINTIGLMEPEAAAGLEEIAKETKGTFKIITE